MVYKVDQDYNARNEITILTDPSTNPLGNNETYTNLETKCLSFALKMTNNKERAEELAQETMFKVWKFRNKYDPNSALLPWVYQIMRNIYHARPKAMTLSLDYEREIRPNEEKIIPLIKKEEPSPQEILEKNERNEKLRKRLSESNFHRFRGYDDMILWAKTGLPYNYIAVMNNCSKETIKTRIHSLKKNLADRLSELNVA